jgi:hypothetical protein
VGYMVIDFAIYCAVLKCPNIYKLQIYSMTNPTKIK